MTCRGLPRVCFRTVYWGGRGGTSFTTCAEMCTTSNSLHTLTGCTSACPQNAKVTDERWLMATALRIRLLSCHSHSHSHNHSHSHSMHIADHRVTVTQSQSVTVTVTDRQSDCQLSRFN